MTDLTNLTEFRGLGGVIGWMTDQGMSLASAEIVQQDEFTLDFIVPLADRRAVVFGIT
jgi:hypothetical protein